MLTHDYEYRVGDTLHGEWVAVVIGGVPVDLTSGWSVRAQVRDRSSNLLVTNLGVQLGTADVPYNGTEITVSTARIHIPATASKEAGVYVGRWDMEIYHLTFDGGEPFRKTIDGGSIRAVQDVTR